MGSALLLCLTLLAAAPTASPWGARPAPAERLEKAPRPRYLQRHDALLEAQDLLGMWQRESREFVEQAEDLERRQGPGIQIFRGEPNDPEPDPEEEREVEAAPPAEQDEEERPLTNAAPDEVQPPRGDDWLEQELARREAQRVARVEKEREESEREREWRLAAEKRAAARAAAIEAEARRMQEELNRARRREEEKRAKAMGGKLDKEGNYVDPDLEEEEE